MQVSSQKVPDILYTLIKIGAILIIIDAGIRLLIAVLIGSLASSGLILSGISISASGSVGAVLLLLSILFIVGIILGVLIIAQTDRLKSNPEDSLHAIYIIVMAVISFLFGGGFIIGSVLVIGCVIIIMLLGTPFSMNFSSMVGKRICPTCGLVSNGNANFCPSCGRKFQ